LLFAVCFSEYQNYFREGFNRGYEDGYYSRSQYGRYSNGTPSLLASVLEQFLNLQLINQPNPRITVRPKSVQSRRQG
jgi:flagellar biosynthesis/type III secretory pathway protein FliH